jgi:Zn-dependent protease
VCGLLAAWPQVGAWSTLGFVGASIAAISLVFSHELGHGFIAWCNSCEVRAIVVSAFGGACVATPPKNAYKRASYFAGGVFTQLLLLCGALLCRQMLNSGPVLDAVLFVFVQLNTFFLVVNLLPTRNFDGARILNALRDAHSDK